MYVDPVKIRLKYCFLEQEKLYLIDDYICFMINIF